MNNIHKEINDDLKTDLAYTQTNEYTMARMDMDFKNRIYKRNVVVPYLDSGQRVGKLVQTIWDKCDEVL
eukprot:SAG31_NODE_7311_length_1723_cov_2.195197_3_plen_69_part_00